MTLGKKPVGKPLNSQHLEQKETPSENQQKIKAVKNIGNNISSADNSEIDKENPKNTKKHKSIRRSTSLDSINFTPSNTKKHKFIRHPQI